MALSAFQMISSSPDNAQACNDIIMRIASCPKQLVYDIDRHFLPEQSHCPRAAQVMETLPSQLRMFACRTKRILGLCPAICTFVGRGGYPLKRAARDRFIHCGHARDKPRRHQTAGKGTLDLTRGRVLTVGPDRNA
jgi:hypothetical protein